MLLDFGYEFCVQAKKLFSILRCTMQDVSVKSYWSKSQGGAAAEKSAVRDSVDSHYLPI